MGKKLTKKEQKEREKSIKTIQDSISEICESVKNHNDVYGADNLAFQASMFVINNIRGFHVDEVCVGSLGGLFIALRSQAVNLEFNLIKDSAKGRVEKSSPSIEIDEGDSFINRLKDLL